MGNNFSIFSWKKDEVVMIAGVMAAILLISLFQLRESEMKTRDAQRKADAGLVARALAQYLFDHTTLPPEKDGNILSCGGKGADVCVWGEGQIQDNMNVVYLKKLPQDPFANLGRTYVYQRDKSGVKFRIYIAVENKRDSETKKDLTIRCGEKVQCNWYAEN